MRRPTCTGPAKRRLQRLRPGGCVCRIRRALHEHPVAARSPLSMGMPRLVGSRGCARVLRGPRLCGLTRGIALPVLLAATRPHV